MKYIVRNALLLAIALSLFALTACGPSAPKWPIGLGALSPKGDWATYTEHSGDPASWRLILVNLVSGESAIIATELDAASRTSFSPSEPYLLYQDSEKWYLVNYSSDDPTSSGREITVGKSEKLILVQFLPDGELLLVVKDEDGWKNLYTIRDLKGDINNPINRSLQASLVRYYFPEEGAFEIKTTNYASLNRLAESPNQTNCGMPKTAGMVRWALVDQSYTVRILVASRLKGVSFEGTLPRLSQAVQVLLQEQEKDIRAIAEKKAKDEAKEAEEVLSSDELQNRVEKLLRDEFPPNVFLSPESNKLLLIHLQIPSGAVDVFAYVNEANSSLYLVDLEPTDTNVEGTQSHKLLEVKGFLFPIFSSDGSKLLVHHVQPAEKNSLYSLYLVDLEAAEFAPLILSRQTDWAPAFTFSPDSRQLLYEADVGDGRALYLANSDGSNSIRVSDENILDFCWH